MRMVRHPGRVSFIFRERAAPERILVQFRCDWLRWWRDGFTQVTLCEIEVNQATQQDDRRGYLTIAILGLGMFVAA